MKLIILSGLKHSGKSTLGRLLAKELGATFYDSDEEMEKLYLEKTGIRAPVRQIYITEGFDGFRKFEAEAMRRMIARRSSRGTNVLALGGGTIENDEALSVLAEEGYFIYLEEDEDVLFERIRKSGIPPFLAGDDPRGRFHDMYARRSSLYSTRADFVVNMRGLLPPEALTKIILHLKERSNGR